MDLNEIATELRRRLAPEQRTSSAGHPYLNHLLPVECADGFGMSVQASSGHYCTPRDSVGPWRAVEVGYPSAKVDAFMPYIDGGQDDDPTDTVYGYVPLEIVAQAVADHGGFAPA